MMGIETIDKLYEHIKTDYVHKDVIRDLIKELVEVDPKLWLVHTNFKDNEHRLDGSWCQQLPECPFCVLERLLCEDKVGE